MADFDLQSLGMRLGEAITPTPSNAPQVRYATVAAVNADGTLDVTIDGTTLRGVCATTGCVGAAAGMRCVVLRQGPLATVVGLIAGTDLADVAAHDATLAGDLAVGGGATFTGRVHELADLPVLWTGAWFMNASQTVPLAEKVSEQAHGVILVWSAYANGTAQNYNFTYHVVPKYHVKTFSGGGVTCNMSGLRFATPASKYVYVRDDAIVGNANNEGSGTANGITYNNSAYVLRAVLGF